MIVSPTLLNDLKTVKVSHVYTQHIKYEPKSCICKRITADSKYFEQTYPKHIEAPKHFDDNMKPSILHFPKNELVKSLWVSLIL